MRREEKSQDGEMERGEANVQIRRTRGPRSSLLKRHGRRKKKGRVTKRVGQRTSRENKQDWVMHAE